MFGTRDANTTLVNCICATNPHCQGLATIYDIYTRHDGEYDIRVAYVVPGSITGCSALESLRLSTLECLYSTSNCFSIIMRHIQEMYTFNVNTFNVENPFWFDARPLVYDSTLNQFPPTIPVSTIISTIMIERWYLTISYDRFYQLCAPSYCSYPDKINTKTSLGIVVAAISIIGGLRFVLGLITPHLVMFLVGLFTKKNRRQQPQGNLWLFFHSANNE